MLHHDSVVETKVRRQSFNHGNEASEGQHAVPATVLGSRRRGRGRGRGGHAHAGGVFWWGGRTCLAGVATQVFPESVDLMTCAPTLLSPAPAKPVTPSLVKPTARQTDCSWNVGDSTGTQCFDDGGFGVSS